MKKLNLILVAIFILIYIVPLGVRPMVYPDESRYAEIPREMITQNKWVVPHLNGLRYFEKPVLGYWLNASAILIFGENPFAIRFFSAIAAALTAIIVYLIAKKYTTDKQTPILTAIIYLTFMQIFFISTFSVLDSMFSLFVTATIALFFIAYTQQNKNILILILLGVCCGLAFLTKGLLAIVIPAVTILPFMIWQQKTNKFLRSIWIPAAAFLLTIAPWTILVHLREADFWNYFIWDQHIRRFFSPAGSQHHPQAVWYFIPVILAGALPWTFLFPSAFLGVKKLKLKDPLIRFALCWLLMPLIFFSLSKGKLGTYIMPCFAPLAILISVGLLKHLQTPQKGMFSTATRMLAIITALPLIALVSTQIIVDDKFYKIGEAWKTFPAAIAFLAYSILLFLAAKNSDPKKKLALFAAAPLLFMASVFYIIPNEPIDDRAPNLFIEEQKNRINTTGLIVSDDKLSPAVCWSYKLNNVFIIGEPGELDYGLKYNDAKHRLLNPKDLKEMIEKNQTNTPLTLITFTKRFNSYRDQLPTPIYEKTKGRFLFAQFAPKTNTNHQNATPPTEARSASAGVN